MQLVRTLLIPSSQNKYKRKIFEILLSLWIANQFSKEEILKLYIASVRFERGVFGLANAIKYFFGNIKSKALTKEESLFLVERLSNISSTIKWDRIDHLIKRGNLEIDRNLILNLYEKQILANRLKK